MSTYLAVATAQGIHIVEQSGENTFKSLNFGLMGHRITSALPLRDGTLIIGTLEGIYRSMNRGQNWLISSVGLRSRYIRWLGRVPGRPKRLLAGTEPANIYVSDDNGISWRECPEVGSMREEKGWFLPYSEEAGCVRGFDFSDSRGYAAVEVGGVLRSDDFGDTWRMVGGCTGDPVARIPDTFIHTDVHSLVVDQQNPGTVYAATGGGLYRSHNGGGAWDCLHQCYCRAIWIDPGNSERILLGSADSVSTNGRIEESLDGGETWRTATRGLTAQWPRHLVERFTFYKGELIAVISSGDVYSTKVSTIHWSQRLKNISHVTAVAVFEQ